MMGKLIQGIGNAVKGAGETLKTMSETRSNNKERKNMLQNLIKSSTDKAYTKKTGQPVPTKPDDSLFQKDEQYNMWSNLKKDSINKYKNLK